MEPWAVNLMHFSVHLVRLEPSFAQNSLRTLFWSKNLVFYEGDFQKLAFRSRVERIGPQQDTNEASKITVLWTLWVNSRVNREFLELLNFEI